MQEQILYNPYFEIHPTSSGDEWYWNLKANNNEIILTSETYTRKHSAKRGIKAVRRCAADSKNFQIRTSSDRHPYFVLRSGNHQVIGVSQMYSHGNACLNGIKAVKQYGALCPFRHSDVVLETT